MTKPPADKERRFRGLPFAGGLVFAFAGVLMWKIFSGQGNLASNPAEKANPGQAADRGAGTRTPSDPDRTGPRNFDPSGRSYEQIVRDLDGNPASHLDVSAWTSSAEDSLRALDSLLAEVCLKKSLARPEAIAWLAARMGKDEDQIYLAALGGEAMTDEETFRKTSDLLRQGNREFWNRFVAASLKQFASRNPEAGFKWVEEIASQEPAKGSDPPPDTHHLWGLYAKDVMKRLLEEDPSEAISFMDQLDIGTNPRLVLENAYLNEMAGENPRDLWEAVRQKQDKPALIQDTITSISHASPAMAARFLAESPLDEEARLTTERGLTESWSSISPKEMFLWLSQNRSSFKSTATYSTLFKNWAQRDITDSSSALSNLPEGKDRDEGIIGLLSGATDIPEESKEAWLNGISDPDTREKARAKFSR